MKHLELSTYSVSICATIISRFLLPQSFLHLSRQFFVLCHLVTLHCPYSTLYIMQFVTLYKYHVCVVTLYKSLAHVSHLLKILCTCPPLFSLPHIPLSTPNISIVIDNIVFGQRPCQLPPNFPHNPLMFDLPSHHTKSSTRTLRTVVNHHDQVMQEHNSQVFKF